LRLGVPIFKALQGLKGVGIAVKDTRRP